MFPLFRGHNRVQGQGRFAFALLCVPLVELLDPKPRSDKGPRYRGVFPSLCGRERVVQGQGDSVFAPLIAPLAELLEPKGWSDEGP